MSGRRCALVLGLFLLASAVPASGGPVNITNQDRFVHVAMPSGSDQGIDETVGAPDNAPFAQTLERTASEFTTLASQVSSFGEAGNVFTASAQGTTSYSAPFDLPGGGIDSDSSFAVTFTLAEARDYTLNGSASFPDTSSASKSFRVALVGPGGFSIASFTNEDFDPKLNDGTQINPTFAKSGTLATGEYTLFAESGVGGGAEGQTLASYNMTFTATSLTTAIPLPAAVWPGVMLLGGMSAASMKKRLRRN